VSVLRRRVKFLKGKEVTGRRSNVEVRIKKCLLQRKQAEDSSQYSAFALRTSAFALRISNFLKPRLLQLVDEGKNLCDGFEQVTRNRATHLDELV
jgi:hypothetical protein